MLLTIDRPEAPAARPPLAPGRAADRDAWQDPWQDPSGDRDALPSAAMVASLLDEGESIEWAGRPAPGGLVRWSLACWAVFLPWTLFCLHWIDGLGLGDPGGLDDPFRWFCLAGYPFLALGIGGLATPLWVGHRARRTLHVITDRRELSFERGELTRSVRHRRAEDTAAIDTAGSTRRPTAFGVPSEGEHLDDPHAAADTLVVAAHTRPMPGFAPARGATGDRGHARAGARRDDRVRDLGRRADAGDGAGTAAAAGAGADAGTGAGTGAGPADSAATAIAGTRRRRERATSA
ncbi:MAG: hypothetical protein AB7P21_13685 [Lautropia sp.]